MMDWSPDAITNLRRLWAEGHSTAEIARRMDTTKNAIIGKAHRLDLAGRPSPIQRKVERAYPKAQATRSERIEQAVAMARAGRATSGIAEALGIRVDTVRGLLREAGLNRPPGRLGTQTKRPPRQPREVAPASPKAPHAAVRYGVTGCRWPHGEPGTGSFRFCEAADLVQGSCYCAEHHKRAYVAASVSPMTLMRWRGA